MNQEQRDTIERLKQHAQRRIWVTFQKEGEVMLFKTKKIWLIIEKDNCST